MRKISKDYSRNKRKEKRRRKKETYRRSLAVSRILLLRRGVLLLRISLRRPITEAKKPDVRFTQRTSYGWKGKKAGKVR